MDVRHLRSIVVTLLTMAMLSACESEVTVASLIASKELVTTEALGEAVCDALGTDDSTFNHSAFGNISYALEGGDNPDSARAMWGPDAEHFMALAVMDHCMEFADKLWVWSYSNINNDPMRALAICFDLDAGWSFDDLHGSVSQNAAFATELIVKSVRLHCSHFNDAVDRWSGYPPLGSGY